MKSKERSGALTKFENEEFKTLLNEDLHQTSKELSKSLNVDELTVSKRLKATKLLGIKCFGRQRR